MPAPDKYVAILGRISEAATLLQQDIACFMEGARVASDQFHAHAVEIDEVCFWYKSVMHAVVGFGEALCASIRVEIASNFQNLELEMSEKKFQELASVSKPMPLKENLGLGFRTLGRAFKADFQLDSGR